MPRSALKICRKIHVTLLETVIAMSLLSVLLVLIFGFFREVSTLSTLAETKQKETFQIRYAESRLAFLFERVVNESANDRNFYFYLDPPQDGISSSPSLVFTFDNEVRADPKISGDVLARLYLSKENELRLAIWPLHLNEPWQWMVEEVLLEDVEELDFSFYMPPERKTDKNSIESGKVDPDAPLRDTWLANQWPKSYKLMPAIIKLKVSLKQSENKIHRKMSRSQAEIEQEFAFVLPSSENPIYYPPR